MRVYKARLYLKTPTARNPSIVVMVMYGDDEEWGTWCRVFKNRGIFPVHSMERDMSENERRSYDAAWRLIMSTYKSWKGLIQDEYRITKDEKWCERINMLSAKNFDLQQIYTAVDHEK